MVVPQVALDGVILLQLLMGVTRDGCFVGKHSHEELARVKAIQNFFYQVVI